MIEIITSMILTFIVFWGLVALGTVALASGGNGLSAWPIFLLFFAAIWAGGLWLTPVGPPLLGIYWMPFLFAAIFIALFWTAASPPVSRTRRTGVSSSSSVPTDNVSAAQQGDTSAAPAGLGILFWLLLVGLALAGLAHYAGSVGPVALR